MTKSTSQPRQLAIQLLGRENTETTRWAACLGGPTAPMVFRRGTDDVLLIDAPGFLREHPHEVAAAAGTHKDPEPVGLQKVEQLQHRLIDQVQVPQSEPGLPGVGHPVPNLRLELGRRAARPGPTERV